MFQSLFCRFGERRLGRSSVWIVVGLLLVAGAFFAPTSTPTAYAQQPSPTFDLTQVDPPSSRPLAVRGQALYAENCSPCHGPTGGGDGPTAAQLPGPPTIFADPEAAWDRTPAEWFYTAKFGRLEALMPPWQTQMSDAEIWDTIYYAWQFHTDELNLVNGQVLYDEQCAACHGPNGAGDGPDAQADLLSLSDPAYAMAVSQSQWLAGWQSAHPEVGAEWTDPQQRNVLEYIRSFNYTPTWQNPYRTGRGVFQGTVVQGSADGVSVAGIEIELDAFMGFEPIANFTTTVTADGTFSFQGLDTEPGLIYMASAYYGGIGYSSQPLNFIPESDIVETEMTVFETTTDPAGLKLSRMHWIVDSQPGFLIVGEIATYGVDGDRTFVGRTVAGMDEPATIALYAPPEALEITFQSGELGGRFQQVGDLIYDTSPVAPGESTRQIIMRYAIPYNDTTANLDQRLLYPTDDLTLLVAELPSLQVDVPGLTFGDVQSMGDQSYLLWQGLELEPQDFAISLSGLIEPGGVDPRSLGTVTSGGAASSRVAASGSNALTGPTPPLETWVILVIGAIVALALVSLLILASRRGGQAQQGSADDLRQERNRLVNEIARLDDLYALGELDVQSWERQRGQLKTQLLKVASQLTDAHAGTGAI